MYDNDLFNQIVTDLTGEKQKLPDALTKTKILASKLNNRPLKKFAHSELLGFADKFSLPTYRKDIFADIVVNGNEGNNIHENIKLQKTSDNRDFLENEAKTNLLIGAAEIHRLIDNQDGFINTYLSSTKTIGFIEYFFRRQISPHLKITSINLMVGTSSLQTIYSHIKDNLLEKVLKAGKKSGLKIDLQSSIANTNIMNNTINNYGDGSINNTGNIETITLTNNIKKGDIDSLVTALEKLKVPQADIAELVTIVNSEPQNLENKSFGEKTSNWIGKMTAKAANGSWQIAIGAAGGILAEIIQKFLG